MGRPGSNRRVSGFEFGKHPRILLARTDRIGDLVLSLPTVRAIRSVIPKAKLDFLVRPETAPIIELQPEIDNIVLYRSESDREFVELLKRKTYDVVICLFPRPELAGAFARAKIPARIGTARRWYSYRFTHRVNISRKKSGRHEKDLNLDLLKALDIAPDYSLVPELTMPTTAVPEIAAKLFDSLGRHPLAVVHPGDGGSAINWPVERYAELAGRLAGDGVKVVVTGSGAECEVQLPHFAGIIPVDHVLSGKTDLNSLMYILNRAEVFVGGSTGPLHLAAALKTPVVGLYGPIRTTTPDRWGPCGEGHTVLTPDVPLCDCKVSHCQKGNCMKRITVDEVVAAAQQIIARRGTDNLPNENAPMADLREKGEECR